MEKHTQNNTYRINQRENAPLLNFFWHSTVVNLQP